MIVVCDVNEIWRRRPFAEMAGMTEVLGVIPADAAVAAAHPAFGGPTAADGLNVLPVKLPRGWASRTAWLGQRLLWKAIRRAVAGRKIEAVVVTSPHYRTLLDQVPQGVTRVYYASDDYRTYGGWKNMAALEKQILGLVDHAFFVSDALAERAKREYGFAEKIHVSMNATEERFAQPDPLAGTVLDPALERPVVGVIGGINARLDFELLERCADLKETGTLLLVGPLPKEKPDALNRLLQHPRVAAVGPKPHETLHRWFQALDAGLIPYVESDMNLHCSPMRLFDHLAAGMPIIATSACDQVNRFRGRVTVCDTAEAFTAGLARALCAAGVERAPADGIFWADRSRAMLEKMGAGLKKQINTGESK